MRTKSAKASGWVRCAPCAAPGISTITEPGTCATSQATASRWWGSDVPPRPKTAGMASSVGSKGGLSSRMAPSSATRAGPSARRSALTLSGRRSHARVPDHPPEESLGGLRGVLAVRSHPRTAGGWIAPEAEPGERGLVRGEREDRSFPPPHRGAERDDAAVTVSDHYRRPPVDDCEEILDVTVDRVVDRGDA